jgi:hypothetical protein
MKISICTPLCNRGLGLGVVEEYLSAIRSHNETKSYKIYLGIMDYAKEDINQLLKKYDVDGVVWIGRREPPTVVRKRIVQEFRGDETHWLWHDDDLFVYEKTTYDVMALKCNSPEVGCISLNWRKTRAMADAVKLENKFVVEPIPNVGGGLMFRSELLDVVIPDEARWTFDGSQYNLNTYLAGYENYRYLGGIAEHRALGRGGKAQSHKDPNFQTILPDSRMIKLKRTSKPIDDLYQAYHMYGTANLTDLARAIHEKNKKRIRLQR